MDPEATRVLTFWFNRPPTEWIIAPAGLDDQIKSSFGDLVEKARRNALDAWTTSPESAVALVVLLDQFSRNIYRGTADAFTADAKARDVAANAIAQDFDKQVSVIKASALYMPLLQDESLISVIAAKCLFEALRARCETEEEKKWVEMGVAESKRHMEMLREFGRYPNRNLVLGRESTEAEEKFTKDRVVTL